MNPLKCPTCGAEPSAIRAIYYCLDGHQWEEHVDRADTPPAPKLEEPGKKLWPFGRHKGTPIEELYPLGSEQSREIERGPSRRAQESIGSTRRRRSV